MQLSRRVKGIISVAGGFLQNFGLGVFYVWGAMSIYVVSYYRLTTDPQIDNDMAVSFLPLSTFPSSLAMLFAVPISNKLGLRKTLILGSVGVAVSTVLASFMPGFWSYLAFFAVLFGVFEGLIFLLPLFVGFSYFPKHTGLVSGIINTGFGLGILGANTISLKLMNPENIPPTLRDQDTSELYFRWDVAYKVPFLTQILGVYLFVILIISSFMIFDANEPKSSEEETLL